MADRNMPTPENEAEALAERMGVLAAEVGAALQVRNSTLATAESCTGGWVGEVITSVAGSSAWFERGFITYSNESKTELLGVPEATLARYGAVSEQSARAMVEGAIARSRADIALAVTGIAGPGGGAPGKPVGLVWFAWAERGREARALQCVFRGDRQFVRAQAVVQALQGLLKLLQERGE